jgi:hypothetical protein
MCFLRLKQWWFMFFFQSRMRCYEQTGWRDIFRGAVASWESVAEHGLPIPIVSLDSHCFDFPFTKICRSLAINNHYFIAMDHHSWFTNQSALIILNPDCSPPRMICGPTGVSHSAQVALRTQGPARPVLWPNGADPCHFSPFLILF